MKNTPILILSFLFLFTPPQKHLVASTTEPCLDTVCHTNGPIIRFPFQIKEKQPNSSSCGYPGFTASCSEHSQTLLNLPNSNSEAEFFTIKSINYATQQLWVNDPNNCVPKRILTLNLTSSPFDAVYYQEFTFFNCSFNLEYLAYRYSPIPCLSDSNHTVFATSSSSAYAYLSSVCNAVKTVKVPVELPLSEHVVSSDLSGDLRLSWDSPSCGKCESHGGRCGFETNTSLQVACSNNDLPSKGISRGARYAIAICIGVPAVLCFIGILSCFCSRFKILTHGWAWDRHTVPDFEPLINPQRTTNLGLDGPTIESYPKIVISDNRILPKPNDTTCPICLSEYRPKETVKSIPECRHCFHAQCIDEWLPLNASCPICRTSPRKLPAAA